jgi:hypothetical protein
VNNQKAAAHPSGGVSAQDDILGFIEQPKAARMENEK